MATDQKKVFLYPSDIAAYIGQNQYDFVTPFERLWKRCDTESYTDIINKSKSEFPVKPSPSKSVGHSTIGHTLRGSTQKSK